VTPDKIVQNKKSGTTFSYRRGEYIYNAVPIPCHKDENAFVQYHYRKPYIDEIVHALGKSPSDEGNTSAGAKRLLQRIAIIAPKEYVSVANEVGLNITGKLDAISLGAMKEAVGLRDWQMIKILKHLKHSFGGKDISVPFRTIKQFSEGSITPRVKKFKHQYKDGTLAWVDCTYASIYEIYTSVVKEMMSEHKIRPIDVVALDVVIGGDHGLNAFRLGLRAIITVTSGKMYHREYGGAGLVTGKDTPDLLEASIMPWLTEDLQAINNQRVILETSDDNLLRCYFVESDEDVRVSSHIRVIERVKIYNTGDLKWMAMLLGMDGMSSEWCLFCFLRRKEWQAMDYEKGDPRTIEKIMEFANNSELTGAQRMGVKRAPYWPFIPVENYAIPLLHLMIGIFNDIIDYFTDLFDTQIIQKGDDELMLEDDYKKMDETIQKCRSDVELFNKSSLGKKRNKLVTRYNKQKKQLQNGDAVTDVLSVEYIAEYQMLQKKFSDVTKPRDNAVSKKKDIKEKLEAYHLNRKYDPTSACNKIEDHWKSKGLDRGKAFGGKFDGKDARRVMNDPGKIFDEQIQDIMITSKRPTVAGEFIIDLCHRVTLLMGHWNKFFSLLQQENPTDTDRTTVRQVADTAVNAHFALLNNKTPKVHVAQEHAVTQYLHVRPGMMRLLMEHWVEKNHQDSARIENTFKHIPNLQSRANFAAGARHAANNSEIKKRIAEVDSKSARGEYKKGRII